MIDVGEPHVENETGGILTVGALRALLDGIPDDYHVTVATDGWYDNIASVDTPNLAAEDHAPCVNVFPANPSTGEGNYDARQH